MTITFTDRSLRFGHIMVIIRNSKEVWWKTLPYNEGDAEVCEGQL